MTTRIDAMSWCDMSKMVKVISERGHYIPPQYVSVEEWNKLKSAEAQRRGHMASRFDDIRYDDIAMCDQTAIKAAYVALENRIIESFDGLVDYRILDKLEESYMWVNKQIRDEQIKYRSRGVPGDE